MSENIIAIIMLVIFCPLIIYFLFPNFVYGFISFYYQVGEIIDIMQQAFIDKAEEWKQLLQAIKEIKNSKNKED